MAEKKSLIRTTDILKGAKISRQVLYRYVQMELIEPVETTPTGRQLFSSAVFKQIELIQRLNESGYTLRDIREIFSRRLRNVKPRGAGRSTRKQ